MAGESHWSLCCITLKHCSSVLLGEDFSFSVLWDLPLYNGKDSFYYKHWQQGPAMGWLTYFWNEWEWQQVLLAFHFSFHTPWLNGKCWTKTAAMFPGSLVGYVQHFSVSYSLSQNIGYPAYSSVMPFISGSSFPTFTFHYFSSTALSWFFLFFSKILSFQSGFPPLLGCTSYSMYTM